MAAPTVINGDFAIPALSAGNTSNNPTGAGVGWTWDNGGAAGNRATIYGPGGNGWPGQSLGLLANNSSSAEMAAYQDLTFDGSPVRLRFWARRRTASSRIWASLGGDVLLAGVLLPADWTEYTFDRAPTGVQRLRFGNQMYSGTWSDLADVRVESASTPGRLVCLGPGRVGLVHTS